MRIARVKSESSSEDVLVGITSKEKPEIPEDFQRKWQKIIDLAAKIIGVPSGLINRLNEETLEIFLTSNTENNIFEKNHNLKLGLGWYCESVAGSKNELLLPNALKDEKWKDNPSIPFNMISYMGVPIFWPDGEVFGTFCVLDNKENQFSEEYKELIISLREIIQNDLKQILLLEQFKNDLVGKELQLREIHHRVKNHFNLLISTISLQSLKDYGSKDIKTVLTDIQSKINAISIIHDKLYFSTNLDKILIGEYLKEIGKYQIKNLYQSDIIFSCNCPDINMPVNVTVSLGFLLSELITNSIKYAFKEVILPEIKVSIEKKENGNIIFEYRDNGIGLPEDFNLDKLDSLGMLLIKISAKQLNGFLKMQNDNGFHLKITFKLPL